MSILFTLLIGCLIAGLVFWILSLFPIPQPWLNICRAFVGIIFVIWLLSFLLPLGHTAIIR